MNNKNLSNIDLIRTAMIVDGTVFHIQLGDKVCRVLTLNSDGSGTIRIHGIKDPVPTFFTDKELANLASLAKGWNRVKK